ncbi:hypothetical protein M0804_010216 [Polistes exclamans]|nr:hypothetical protein M0804_010216 [Polistes exclamans]
MLRKGGGPEVVFVKEIYDAGIIEAMQARKSIQQCPSMMCPNENIILRTLFQQPFSFTYLQLGTIYEL